MAQNNEKMPVGVATKTAVSVSVLIVQTILIVAGIVFLTTFSVLAGLIATEFETLGRLALF